MNPPPLPDGPKAPTVSKAPPAGRKFPCPSCGAKLDFDPAVAGLKCPYCGYEQKIDTTDAAEVVERDYLEYLAKEESKGVAIPGRSTETKCTGCGAVVLLEDKVATEKCPFCGTHLESTPHAAQGMIQPESLLPFAVDLRKARDHFDRWLGSLWFAPSELRKVANLGQLTGVYLPHWTYDAMTYTSYEGQRGDDYTTTETYTDTDSDGKQVTRTRTVTHTNWTYVSGRVDHFFDDVLVPASKSIPEDLINDLHPWELHKLEAFNPSYLSGFKTERYAVGLKEGLAEAKHRMEPTIDRLVRSDIGGDHQRIDNKRTRYSGITFKHLLLPTWVAVYRYHEKTFQILVNGRTGKVTGYRPWSTAKIVALVLAILLAVAVVIGLVAAFGGKSGGKRRSGTPAPVLWHRPLAGVDLHRPEAGATRTTADHPRSASRPTDIADGSPRSVESPFSQGVSSWPTGGRSSSRSRSSRTPPSAAFPTRTAAPRLSPTPSHRAGIGGRIRSC